MPNTTKAVILFGLITGFLANSFIVLASTETLQNKVTDLEGKIMLQNGKALLTTGNACIIQQEALADEALAIKLVRACVRAQKEKEKKNEQKDLLPG